MSDGGGLAGFLIPDGIGGTRPTSVRITLGAVRRARSGVLTYLGYPFAPSPPKTERATLLYRYLCMA